ncbi:hypothetical protein PAXRUDRAFT_832164 [Paxillus rubicundulus Ve08.2h10]|uniref:T6SS Phospholipase effector Tle1-like catalytic domain-containing protein n=1 Tax=Paxillus rubicundulus Ve08.2h10 TaxID=930991 RepID=A0A0D0D3E6_9AGAM|nr:hypothetical protein PAXRUDRAFT_832164 [Paxillus rubicundulus Ve08.2h10]
MPETRSADVPGCSARPPRTIVLCFDGTNGQFDSTNSNVVKFCGLLRKDLPEQQLLYYQAGIGTYFAPGVVSPLLIPLAQLLDQAVAWYLDAHVMGGYKYLMENYRLGDKVCLFGFSRGAYTARALAGMLSKVGLLQKDNVQQVNFAYKAYTRTDEEGIKLAAGFKKTFSLEMKIDFVGVWDTVQSTGVLVNRVLPFTDSNTAIRVFRQALALDEHRSRFRPDLYHWPAPDIDDGSEETLLSIAQRAVGLGKALIQKFEAMKSVIVGINRRERKGTTSTLEVDRHQTNDHGALTKRTGETEDVARVPGDEIISEAPQSALEFVTEESSTPTDVLEVWFAGCHSDIGGGNVQDDVEVSLAHITLHWMVDHVIQSKCGILFDNAELARIGYITPACVPNPQVPAAPEEIPLNANGHNPLPVTPAPPSADTTAVVKESDDHIEPQLAKEPSEAASEPSPEFSNALAPLFDKLKLNKLWWLLEVTPFSYAWQGPDGVWHHKWGFNFGKGRVIPFKQPKFHHTVKERMAYQPLSYKPRAVYDHHEVYV